MYYNLGNRTLNSTEVQEIKERLSLSNVDLIQQRGSDVANYRNLKNGGLLGFTQSFVNNCEVLAANRANLYIKDQDTVYITVGMDAKGVVYGAILDDKEELVDALKYHRFQIKRRGECGRARLVTYHADDLRKTSITLEEAIFSVLNTGRVAQITSGLEYHHNSYTFDARSNNVKCFTHEQHREYHAKNGQGSHQIPMLLDVNEKVPEFKAA